MKKFKKSKYPNGNRTNAQRRARYCFLRQSGFSRKETRTLTNWRDSKMVAGIKQYGEFLNEQNIKVS